MESSLTKKIIFDYFDGKHSSMQYKMIEEWLKVKENQELFYQYLDEWESQNPQYFHSLEQGFEKIKQNLANAAIEKQAFETIEDKSQRDVFLKWFGMAAAMLIFAWVGWSEFSKPTKVSYENLVQNTKKQTGEIYEKENTTAFPMLLTLPDESSVILQPQSRISYSPQQYNKNKRDVILSGEAFFEVQKNSKNPFFVYANGLITKVLGTSFSVKTNLAETEVIVKTGRVSIIMQNDIRKNEKINGKTLEGLVLEANQQVKINQNDEKIEKPAIVKQDQLFQIIQKLSFDFDDTPATEILEVIKKAYNIEISYNKEKLANCKLTAHLSDEPLIEKIKLICIALDATYEESDNKFIIKSSGCK
ncbi:MULTISPECIES: FecR family protein [Emticicia]|uniref:FecR family protein n=1 Tax=Emticicia TaxID=312278 RepID=UPI0007D8C4B1|nr:MULTISPECIES: FecR family protein [Emticicia]